MVMSLNNTRLHNPNAKNRVICHRRERLLREIEVKIILIFQRLKIKGDKFKLID